MRKKRSRRGFFLSFSLVKLRCVCYLQRCDRGTRMLWGPWGIYICSLALQRDDPRLGIRVGGKKKGSNTPRVLDYSDRALERENSSFTSLSSRPGRQKKSTNTCLSCCALREGCFNICTTFVNIASVKATRSYPNPQAARGEAENMGKSTSAFSFRATVTSLTEAETCWLTISSSSSDWASSCRETLRNDFMTEIGGKVTL